MIFRERLIFTFLLLGLSAKGAEVLDDNSVYDLINLFESSPNSVKPQVHNPKLQAGVLKCNACEFVMKEIDWLFQKDITKLEFMHIMDNFCSKIRKHQDECHSLVANHIGQIYDLIFSQFSPMQICEVIRLCEFRIHDFRMQACALCSYALSKIKDQTNTDLSPEHIEPFASKLCQNAGRWQPMCHELIISNSEVILKNLIAEVRPLEICQLMNVCPTPRLMRRDQPSNETTDLVAPAVATSSFESKVKVLHDDCALCQFLIEYARLATVYQKQVNARDIMQKLCNNLGHTYMNTCKQIVFSDFKGFMDAIGDNSKTTSNICRNMKYCPEDAKPVNPVFLLPSVVTKKICSVCRLSLSNTEWLIQHDFSRAFVEGSAKAFCHLTSAISKSAFCEHAFGRNITWIIDQLKAKQTPAVICLELNMCPESEIKPSDLAPTVSAEQLCQICETGLDYLREFKANSLAQNNFTITDYGFSIITNRACVNFTTLNAVSVDTCYKLLSEKIRLLDAFSSLGMNTQDSCQAMEYCPAEKTPNERHAFGEREKTHEDYIHRWCMDVTMHKRPLCRVVLRFYIAKDQAVISFNDQNGRKHTVFLPPKPFDKFQLPSFLENTKLPEMITSQ